jgi:hypothetical protein
VFFTIGGTKLYASVAMLAVSVGAAEKVYGTSRTFAMFWGIHLATLLIASVALVLPLHLLETYRGTLLANVRDVGPSAGYYGCAGAVCVAIPERWRIAVIGFVLTILALRLTWSMITIPDHGRAISADLAHIIAFPLGIAVASLSVVRIIPQPI